MRWRLAPEIDLANPDISPADAGLARMRTASVLLDRFASQPGVVLADEVGLGKTFVALAVAYDGVIVATNHERPVVVMVPAGVQDKWPREWDVFCQRCLDGKPRVRATSQTVRSAADFLKLLDDGKRTRHHLIFLTHGAFTNFLSDDWTPARHDPSRTDRQTQSPTTAQAVPALGRRDTARATRVSPTAATRCPILQNTARARRSRRSATTRTRSSRCGTACSRQGERGRPQGDRRRGARHRQRIRRLAQHDPEPDAAELWTDIYR